MKVGFTRLVQFVSCTYGDNAFEWLVATSPTTLTFIVIPRQQVVDGLVHYTDCTWINRFANENAEVPLRLVRWSSLTIVSRDFPCNTTCACAISSSGMEEAGTNCRERSIIPVRLQNVPGRLAAIITRRIFCERLAAADAAAA